jgi:DnaJ-class molecular chaperone
VIAKSKICPRCKGKGEVEVDQIVPADVHKRKCVWCNGKKKQ